MPKKEISINYSDRDIDRLINHILFLIRSNQKLKYVSQKWDNLSSNDKQEVELKLKCMIECILTNSPPCIDFSELDFVDHNDIPNLCYYIKIAMQNIFITDNNHELISANRIHNVVSFTHDRAINKPEYIKKQKSIFRWKI